MYNYVFRITGGELFKEHYRLCKIGNEILTYFACSLKENLQNSKEWKHAKLVYLGQGTILLN